MTGGKPKMDAPSKENPLQTIEVEYLSFSSYSLICTVISICLGIVGSVLFFVIDLLGLDTSVQLGLLHLNDTETGVVVLFVGPFIFGLIGFIGSLFTHRMFLWTLRRFSDFRLTGIWKTIPPSGDFNAHHQNGTHPSEAQVGHRPH